MWGTASYQLMAEFAAILLNGGEGLAADPEVSDTHRYF